MIKREVIKAVANVNIDGDDHAINHTEPGMFTSYLQENSELVNKSNELVKKLNSKNVEIERLCVLLESIEPIPGVDIEKYRKLIDSAKDDAVGSINIDYRDTKIVQLAKKVRNLTMLLNKEKAVNESRLVQIGELERKYELIEKEIDASKSSSYHNSGSSSSNISSNRNFTIKSAHGPGEVVSDAVQLVTLKKEIRTANKSIEDLRRKNIQTAEENKALSRALAKELGEGVEVEDALNGTWRGRAQQIVMLKSKIKKLELQQQQQSLYMPSCVEDGGSIQTYGMSDRTVATGTTTNYNNKRELDVDSKALGELADMSKDRREAVEMLTEDRNRLMLENQALEVKANGHKARIKNLESDTIKFKQQVRVMIEKTETDDQLISALREELDRLRGQLTLVKSVAHKEKEESVSRVKTLHNTTSSSGELELKRLQRLVQQQAAQLSTQEEVIRELRRK